MLQKKLKIWNHSQVVMFINNSRTNIFNLSKKFKFDFYTELSVVSSFFIELDIKKELKFLQPSPPCKVSIET